MELYNEEMGKLRKKDKVAYYYDKKKRFLKVPTMNDDKEDIYEFIKFCISLKYPKIDDQIIQEEWTKLEENTPLIIDAMEQLKAEAEESGADVWKVRSYDKAIKTIESIKVPIISGNQAMKLPGIGKGMAGVISEVLKHGRLRTQEERMESAIERQTVTEEFVKIWDTTPKVANIWYNFGYRTMKDLQNNDKQLKMTEKQRLGIEYFDDLQKPIPKDDVILILKLLKRSQKITDDIWIVGPARRGEDDNIKVAEFLICVPKIGKPITKKIIDALKSSKDIDQILEGSLDAKKFSGIVKIGGDYHRLDINMVNEDECGPSLIQYTGPDGFIKQMKEQAAVMGYGFGGKKGFVKFSEGDNDDQKIDAKREYDVFNELGMDFVEPQKRF